MHLGLRFFSFLLFIPPELLPARQAFYVECFNFPGTLEYTGQGLWFRQSSAAVISGTIAGAVCIRQKWLCYHFL
ncbi:hypothetical protein WJR50_15825 [Catalinimonas sp. 4WD22]|uniref:hypothetical protein n=1 Tax=Catalinimonas locisalis TaxID=3133978 RepID=UPI003100BEBB